MSVPTERLTAVDIYHFLDWLKEAFAEGDQLIEVEEWRDGRPRLRVIFKIDRQLDRLERVLAHIPEPRHSQAMQCVAELKRARLSRTADTSAIFVRLGAIVAAWDRDRPSFVCGYKYADGVCQVACRSAEQLAEHRRLVHDDEAAA